MAINGEREHNGTSVLPPSPRPNPNRIDNRNFTISQPPPPPPPHNNISYLPKTPRFTLARLQQYLSLKERKKVQRSAQRSVQSEILDREGLETTLYINARPAADARYGSAHLQFKAHQVGLLFLRCFRALEISLLPS